MSLCEQPGWIQLLYIRGHAGSALHSRFSYDTTRSEIVKLVESHSHGQRQLRDAALELITEEEQETIAMSLFCWGIVGFAEDAKIAISFRDHKSDLVQKAAKCCLFELRHKEVIE